MALPALLLLLFASWTGALRGRGPRMPRDLPPGGFVISRIAIDEPSDSYSPLHISDHVIKLERGNGSSLSSLYVNAIRAQAAGEDPHYSRIKQVRVLLPGGIGSY